MTSNDFAAMFDQALNKADESIPSKRVQDYKCIGAEMTAFEKSGEKTANLEKLYAALMNLPPTSVSCERVFSVSGNFGNKQRARLSDKSLDSLVFLKYYFQKF